MPCSAVSLSIATIFSVTGVACLAIAFSTDNWTEIRVNRNLTRERLLSENSETGELPTEFETDYRYFSRDEGLFRVCFVNKKPKDFVVYTSPTQQECFNVNYYIPEDENSDKFSDERWERLHYSRTVVALYSLSFFFLFLSFFTGIAGCWKRSHANLVATGILQLVSSLMDCGSMGFWHTVQYYDVHKLKDELSYEAWPPVLKQSGIVTTSIGWSYCLSWTGITLTLLSSLLFLCSAQCIRRQKRQEQNANMQYLMPVYDKRNHPYGYYGYYPQTYASPGYAYPY